MVRDRSPNEWAAIHAGNYPDKIIFKDKVEFPYKVRQTNYTKTASEKRFRAETMKLKQKKIEMIKKEIESIEQKRAELRNSGLRKIIPTKIEASLHVVPGLIDVTATWES